MPQRVYINVPTQSAIVVESSSSQVLRQVVRTALRELCGPHVHFYPGTPVITHDEEGSDRVEGTFYEQEHRSGEDIPPASDGSTPEVQLARYCRSVNPVGDMRRAVLAAMGAEKYLGVHQVSAQELQDLFATVGWPPSGNFIQTLRNAARSSFRWVERVPGRPGYYTVTAKGRDAVLKEHS